MSVPSFILCPRCGRLGRVTEDETEGYYAVFWGPSWWRDVLVTAEDLLGGLFGCGYDHPGQEKLDPEEQEERVYKLLRAAGYLA